MRSRPRALTDCSSLTDAVARGLRHAGRGGRAGMEHSRSLTRMALENQSVAGDDSDTATSAVLGRGGRRVPGDDARPEPSAAASSSQWASTHVAPMGLEGCLAILSPDVPCGGQSKREPGSRKTNKGGAPSVATGMAQRPVGKPRAPTRDPSKGTSDSLKSHGGGGHRNGRASADTHPQSRAVPANDDAPSSPVRRHHGRDGSAPPPLGVCPTCRTTPQSRGAPGVLPIPLDCCLKPQPVYCTGRKSAVSTTALAHHLLGFARCVVQI